MTAQADHLANKKLNLEKATNFMRQYRDPHSRELKKLSANQFMEVWSHYDKDGKLYISLSVHVCKQIHVVCCVSEFKTLQYLL